MAGKTLKPMPMTPAPEPNLDDEKGFGVEHDEYDCGRPCTENGCPGHAGAPVGFWLDGALFYASGYEGGDFPSGSINENRQVWNAVAKVERLYGLEERLRKLADEWRTVAKMRFDRAEPPGDTEAVASESSADSLIQCAEDIEELLREE
jgi:hypothetical protein